jgi:rubrerythrin
MGFFGQVREWLRGDRRPPRDILNDLLAAYEGELQAARQLRSHAERVPYAQAALALRELAEKEDRHAEALSDQIRLLGGALPAVEPAIYEGRNHWDRMAANFQQADEKRRRYLEQSIHWDIQYPREAALLSTIAAEEAVNRRALEELVARADSLAVD